MITVVIPVLNEARTIASVVAFAKQAPNVTEVIVVDDGSTDGTPHLAQRAGARVFTATSVGKGSSMEDGVAAATNDVILFLDGDLAQLEIDLIPRMTWPIINGRADLVKANFTREAGRVTTLTARPLLLTFFPEVAHIQQPLGGILAGSRRALSRVRFEPDYGVDVGILLDAVAAGARVEQVDVGRIVHDSQSLNALGEMAKQVARVILDRAARYGRLAVVQPDNVDEVERHADAALSAQLQRIQRPQRLALFDMDGTLVAGRFVAELAKRTDATHRLSHLLDNLALGAEERTAQIGALFTGVPKALFEETARAMPLMPGAVEVVAALRKVGYCVGIVSDSFRVAAEVVRRRVLGEFSVANLMTFREGIATGVVTPAPGLRHPAGCPDHVVCKRNVVQHMCERLAIGLDQVLSVGDSDPDACMLQVTGQSVAYQPKSERVARAAQHVLSGTLLDILPAITATGRGLAL